VKQRYGSAAFYKVSSEDLIKRELASIRSETISRYEKLRVCSDSHIGLEILHLFILDILGRNTPVAKIFLSKSENDFRHSMVVTRNAKYLAWVAVFAINMFFVYFSVLRGLQRGLDWQRSYLTGCIIQLALEILVYETSECAIVNYFIPNLALREVHHAREALNSAIEIVCGSNSRKFQIILDAPSYLFVSSNLAKSFPSLLESIIVSSYHSCTPGSSAKLWRFNQPLEVSWWAFWPNSSNNHNGGRVFFTSMLLSALQHLGASSPTLQRLLIHGVQPLFVSAIFLMWIVLFRHPLWWAVIGPLILFVFGFLAWTHFRQSHSPSIGDKQDDVMCLSRNISALIPLDDERLPVQWVAGAEEQDKGSDAADSSDDGDCDGDVNRDNIQSGVNVSSSSERDSERESKSKSDGAESESDDLSSDSDWVDEYEGKRIIGTARETIRVGFPCEHEYGSSSQGEIDAPQLDGPLDAQEEKESFEGDLSSSSSSSHDDDEFSREHLSDMFQPDLSSSNEDEYLSSSDEVSSTPSQDECDLVQFSSSSGSSSSLQGEDLSEDDGRSSACPLEA
jgi:hypothetical protein